jgi:hypothetical protein
LAIFLAFVTLGLFLRGINAFPQRLFEMKGTPKEVILKAC